MIRYRRAVKITEKEKIHVLNAIYQFFGSIIRFFFDLTGNYTVALLAFTLIMQLILLPLGIKQQKNQVKQARLAPKIAAIRKKYAGRTDQATQQKMQQETMDLYQRENFNPAGGCLPLLIQLPIIMLLYNVVSKPLSYILKYSSETIASITEIIEATGVTIAKSSVELDIAHRMSVMGADKFAGLDLGVFPDFKLFGMDLTQAPLVSGKVSDWRLLIIPVITFVAMYGSQIIIRRFSYQSPEVQEQQKSMSMKIMNISMPLMSVYFSAIWPGTLGVYWILRNILQTLQQIMLAKTIPVPEFSEEDYKAAERELAGKSAKKKNGEKKTNDENGGKKVRSLHYIDADDDETQVATQPVSDKNEEPKPSLEEAKNGAADRRDPAVEPAPLKDDGDKPKKN